MLSTRRVAALLLGLTALATPLRAAHANRRAPLDASSARLTGPYLPSQTPLVVREERLSIQCGGTADDLVCAFEARYRVVNPSGEAAGGRAAFYGVSSEGLVVSVDGRRSVVPLSPDEQKVFHAEALRAQGNAVLGRSLEEKFGTFERLGFEVSVPPGGSSEIVVTALIKPDEMRRPNDKMLTPMQGRHLFLRTDDPGLGSTKPRELELKYISPKKPEAEAHRVEVSVRYPESWGLASDFRGAPERSRGPWRERPDGDWSIKSRSTSEKLEKEDVTGSLELSIRLSVPLPRFENGGPFIGIGSVVGSSEAAGFRARFGYEVAVPWWLVESLTVDTDFDRRVVLSPNIELAMPQYISSLGIPALSVGAGVPVQVAPKVAVGGRVIGDIQLAWLGFVAAVDMFPALSPEEGRYQVSLMGRMSF